MTLIGGGAITGAINNLSALNINTSNVFLQSTNVTAPIFVNSGFVRVRGGSAIGDLARVTLAAGTTLEILRSETIGSVNGPGSILVSSFEQSLTIGGDNSSFEVANVRIEEINAKLIKIGTGTFTVSGDYSQIAGLEVQQGTLQIGNGTAGGAFTLGDTNVSPASAVINGTLAINRSDDVVIGGSAAAISGTGNLIQRGTGTLTLGRDHSYSGLTTVERGTLVAASNGALGSSAGGTVVQTGAALVVNGGVTNSEAITINGTGVGGLGALRFAGANTTVGTITLGSDARIGFAGSGRIIASGIVGNGHALTIGSVSALDLQGGQMTGLSSLTYEAGNHVLANATIDGPVFLQSGASLLTNGAISGASFGRVNLAAGSTLNVGVATGAGSIDGLGHVNLVSRLTVGSDNSSTTIGSISGGEISTLTKVGTGTLTVAGSYDFWDDIVVEAGTLQIGNGGAGGAFTLGETNRATASAVINGTLAINRSDDVVISDTAASISGTGNLIQRGTGTLTLSGANSYSGLTTVERGTLVAASNGALGSSAGGTVVQSGATLVINNTVTNSEAITINGSGVGGLGALRFAGANTTVGTITLGSDARIGFAGSGRIIASGIVGNGHALTIGSVSALDLRGGQMTGLSSLTYEAGNHALRDVTINGPVFLQSGAGLVTSGAISGASFGRVNLAAGSTLSAVVATGAGSIDGLGHVSVNGGLTVGGDNSSTTIGSISVSELRTFTKVGTGTLTVAGSFETFGITTVEAGTLQIGDGGAVGTVTFSDIDLSLAQVIVNGTLAFNRSDDVPSARSVMAISGTGNIIQRGTGTLTLGLNNTYSGLTTVERGTLVAASNGALGSSAGGTVVQSGATLVVNGVTNSEAITINGSGVGGRGALRRADGAGNTAVGSVTLGSDATIGLGSSITAFSLGSLDGAGHTLTMVGFGQVRAAISNIASLQVNGEVILENMTVTAPIFVNGGYVQVSAGNPSTVGRVTLAAGTELRAGGDGIVGSVNGPGKVYLPQTSDLTVGGDNTSFEVGSLGGMFETSLRKVGTGTFTVAGDFALNGFLRVDEGTLQIGNGGSVGGVSFVLADFSGNNIINGTLAFNRSDSITVDTSTYALTGTGNIVQRGTGTLTLGHNNTLSGTATVEAGTLVLAGSNAFSSITVGGGTLRLANNLAANGANGIIRTTGSVIDYADLITMATPLELRSDTTQLQVLTGTATQAGVISQIGGARPIEKIGAGVLVLTGNNTFTGNTLVSAGELRVTGGQSLSDTGRVTIAAGATLRAVISQETIGSLAGDGQLRFQEGGSVIVGDASSTTFSGTITQGGPTGGAFIKRGTGTLTLSGANTYAAQTRVEGGTLSITNASGLGTIAGGTSVSSGASLLFVGSAPSLNIAEALTISGTGVNGGGAIRVEPEGSSGDRGVNLRGGVTLAGDATITVTDRIALNFITGGIALGGNTLTFASEGTGNSSIFVNSAISGTGGLIKNGPGGLTLSGTNTFTGPLMINGDTVTVSGGTALADTVAVTVGSGAILNVLGSETIGSLTGSGRVILRDAATLTVGGNNTSTTYSGTGLNGLVGTGNLAKIGTGTLVLSGNNGYSGTTTISGGTLQIGEGGATGTLGGGAVTIGADGTLASNRSDTFTLANVIGGSGVLRQIGTGTTILTGDSSGFAGTTEVAAGILRVNGSLGGTITVNGGTLGGSGTIAGGAVINSGGVLGAGNSPGTLTFGSLTLNAGSLTTFELGEADVVGGPNNDLIIVTGALNINGGAIGIDQRTGFANGRYTLFQFDTRNGSLSNLTLNPLTGGFVGTLALDGNSIILNAAPPEDLIFWNGSTTSPTNAVVGGSGTWNFTNRNFTENDGIFTGVWAGNGFNAVFSGTAGTVTIAADTTVAPSGLAFLTDGYTITGGNAASRLALTGPTGIDTAAGVGATISAALSGIGSMTKTGTGTLTLSGNNSGFTGAIAILGGTLEVSSSLNLGLNVATGAITIDGGTLRTAASAQTGRSLTIGAGGGTIDTAAPGQLTLTGDVTFTGQLIKTGAGALELAGLNNSGAGGVRVDQGRLAIRFGNSLGTGTLTLGTGTTLFAGAQGITLDNRIVLGGGAGANIDPISPANPMTLTGEVSGGQLNVVGGAGRLVLTGTNTYGATTVAAGNTLQIGNGGTTGTLGSGGVTLTAATSALIFNRSNDLDVANVISGAGSLTKQGAGTLTLSGDNSGFTGAIAVLGGTLSVGARLNLGNAAATSAITIDGGTLRTAGGYATNRSLTIGAGGGTIDVQTSIVNVFGNVTFTGELVKTGAGRLFLSGLNNSGAGGVRVEQGGLMIARNTSLGTGTLTLGTGAELFLFQPGLTLTNGIVLGGGAGSNIDPFDNVNPTTLAGVLSGGQLNVVGGLGRLVLTGANTYGATTVAAGNTLQIGNGGTTGTLGTGGVTLTAATSALIFNRSNDLVVANVISGAGALVKQGAGTLTLSGANTYTGETRVEAGTLALGASGVIAGPVTNSATFTNGGTVSGGVSNSGSLTSTGAINGGLINQTGGTASLAGAVNGAVQNSGTVTLTGTTTGITTFDQVAGGVFDLAGFATTIGGLSGAGEVRLGGGNLTVNTATSTDFSGVISGSGGLIKTGTATLTLSGANTFAGPAVINAGSIFLATGASLAGGVENNATFINSGTIAGLVGNTATLISAGSLDGGLTNGVGANGQLANTVRGTIANAGTITLTANLGGGAALIQLSAGAFNLAGFNAALGSIAGSGTIVLGTGTLSAGSNNGSTTFSGVISGTGALVKQGTGTLSLSGANTYTGETRVEAGTLALGASGVIAGPVVNSATFTNAGTVSGGATNSGTLTNTGTIAGQVGNAAGASATNSGTIGGSLVNAGTFSNSGIVSGGVTNSGTLTSTGTIATGLENTGTASLAGAVGGSVLNGGTVTLTGTTSGITAFDQVAGGVFDLGGLGTTIGSLAGAGSVNLGAGTLTTGGSNGSTTFSGVIAGSGGLTKTGTGTFTLAGVNTFTGLTTVSAGTLVLASGAALAGAVTNAATFNSDGTVGGLVTNSGQLRSLGTLGAGLTNTAGASAQLAGSVNGAISNAGAIELLGNLIAGGAFTQAATGSLNLAGFSAALGSLAGSGTIVLGGGALGSGALSVGSNNGSTTFSGVISGAGTLTKQGTGTLTLNAVQTFTGLTTVSGGTLTVSGTGGLAGAVLNAASLTNAGTIGGQVSNTASLTNTGTIAGQVGNAAGASATNSGTIGGSLVNAGTFSNSGTVSGGVTNSGTLTSTGTIATGLENTGTASLAGGLNGFVTNTGAITLAGTTSGITTFSQTAAGSFSLAGFNTALGALSGAGSVALGAARLTVGSGLSGTTFAGVISGSGSLEKVGAAGLTLTGANTYTGGTTITAGVLQIGENGTTGAIIGPVVNNGALVISRSDAVTFASLVSGTGMLVQDGTGTTTLTAANTYSGGTLVNRGRLAGTTASLQGLIQINTGAALEFAQGAAGTFAGQLAGTGLFEKTGAGLLTLTGNSNAFTGATSVTAGELRVNGGLAGSVVTVGTGATLSGTGTIGGLVAQSGSTIAPGTSPGVLGVAGNVTLQAGSTSVFEVSATGPSDLILATGTATLGGTAALVNLGGTYGFGSQIALVQADGGTSGTFANVTGLEGFGIRYRPELVYVAGQARLRMAPNTLANIAGTAALTANQRAVVSRIDGAMTAGYNPDPLFAIYSLPAAQLPGAFDQLSGEAYATAAGVGIEQERLMREAVLGRLAASSQAGRNAPENASGLGVWGQVYGGWGEGESNGNAAAFDADRMGFITGLDYGRANENGSWRIGAYGMQVQSDVTIAARGSASEVRQTGGGVYAGLTTGGFAAALGGYLTEVDLRTFRSITLPGFTDNLTGTTEGKARQAFAEVSYTIAAGAAQIRPFVAGSLGSFRLDALTERGGAAALAMREQRYDTGTVTGGIDAGVKVGKVLHLGGTLAARRHLGDRDPQALLALAAAPQQAFAINGAQLDRTALAARLDAILTLEENLSITLGYTGLIGNTQSDHGARATIQIRF